MRKKYQYSMLLLVIMAIGMTACSGQKTEVYEAETDIVEVEADDDVMFGLYTQQGVLCVKEEEGDVRETGKLMLQNLELEEYLNEGISLLVSDYWFETLMQGQQEGNRIYLLQRASDTVLLIDVGYDEAGETYSDVWFLGEQSKMLHHSGNKVQLLSAKMVDGQYEGDFESWLCDGGTGDISYETGTFANGVLTGNYTAAIHSGTEGSDVYSLWCNKETMNYVVYESGQAPLFTIEEMGWKRMPVIASDTAERKRTEVAILSEEEPEEADAAASVPASKPASKPTPVPEAEPTPEPEPTPVPEVTPSPAPTPAPVPEPEQNPVPEETPETDSGADTNANDVDVEWTPDIL